MQNNKALCVISKDYEETWLEFLNEFNNYDVYFLIDKNDISYKDHTTFSKVKIIQIENQECEKAGYIHAGDIPAYTSPVLGWDKALYYFGNINNNYEYVWFLEDDVFLKSEYTVKQIDDQNLIEDLLAFNTVEHKLETGEQYPNIWWWHSIYLKNLNQKNSEGLKSPFYMSLTFHARLSKTLLTKIKEHASVYNTLYFHEAIIPSICARYNLKYRNLDSFNPVSQPSSELPIDSKQLMFTTHKDSFFHPVKNKQEQKQRRLQLRSIEKD